MCVPTNGKKSPVSATTSSRDRALLSARCYVSTNATPTPTGRRCAARCGSNQKKIFSKARPPKHSIILARTSPAHTAWSTRMPTATTSATISSGTRRVNSAAAQYSRLYSRNRPTEQQAIPTKADISTPTFSPDPTSHSPYGAPTSSWKLSSAPTCAVTSLSATTRQLLTRRIPK